MICMGQGEGLANWGCHSDLVGTRAEVFNPVILIFLPDLLQHAILFSTWWEVGREKAAHHVPSTEPVVFSGVCLALVQRPGAGQKPIRDPQWDNVPPQFPEQLLLPHLLCRWVRLWNDSCLLSQTKLCYPV